MNNIPLRPYNYPLTVAVPEQGGPISGRYVRCLQSNEDFVLRLDSQELPFRAGQWVQYPREWPPFERLQVVRAPGAALPLNTIKLVVGDVIFGDDALTFAGNVNLAPGTVIQNKVAVRLTSPNADVALVADTNTAVLAADADVESVDVWNDSATVYVRVATAPGELSATRGLWVPPKSSRSVRMNGALYARSIGGAATISINTTKFA